MLNLLTRILRFTFISLFLFFELLVFLFFFQMGFFQFLEDVPVLFGTTINPKRVAAPYLEHRTANIYWVELPPPAGVKPTANILLIHGTPGDWHAWDALREYMRKANAPFRLLMPDRPGFGQSYHGVSVTSLAAQAKANEEILAQYDSLPLIVVGHSYGGPVAARFAIDHVDQVNGLLLLAASVDPSLESVSSLQLWVSRHSLRPLVPRMLRVCNDELIALQAESRAMMPLWSRLKMPIRVLQGDNDNLVPADNAVFTKRQAPQAQIQMLPKTGHLFPFTNPEIVYQAILELEKTISSAHPVD
jgi:pimeloyl-ACP methyl ester carboxylesterase